MTATVRITITDNDGDEPELVYILDNTDTREEALEVADYVASTHYAHTGILPVLPDGTPYYGSGE